MRLFAFFALFLPASAMAGGFAISEMGSRYAGRGNAVVAVAGGFLFAGPEPAVKGALRTLAGLAL